MADLIDRENETVIQAVRITCNVCGATPRIHKTGVCVEHPLIGFDTFWDYMNCPECGCQILLNKRLKDVSLNVEVDDGD